MIPANDDAVNSIKTISNLVAQAVNEGKEQWEKNKASVEKESKRIEIKSTVGEEKNLAGKSSVVKAAAAKTVKKERRAMTKESSI